MFHIEKSSLPTIVVKFDQLFLSTLCYFLGLICKLEISHKHKSNFAWYITGDIGVYVFGMCKNVYLTLVVECDLLFIPFQSSISFFVSSGRSLVSSYLMPRVKLIDRCNKLASSFLVVILLLLTGCFCCCQRWSFLCPSRRMCLIIF